MNKKNLLEVQRSWISYKIKQCNFEVAPTELSLDNYMLNV